MRKAYGGVWENFEGEVRRTGNYVAAHQAILRRAAQIDWIDPDDYHYLLEQVKDACIDAWFLVNAALLEHALYVAGPMLFLADNPELARDALDVRLFLEEVAIAGLQNRGASCLRATQEVLEARISVRNAVEGEGILKRAMEAASARLRHLADHPDRWADVFLGASSVSVPNVCLGQGILLWFKDMQEREHGERSEEEIEEIDPDFAMGHMQGIVMAVVAPLVEGERLTRNEYRWHLMTYVESKRQVDWSPLPFPEAVSPPPPPHPLYDPFACAINLSDLGI
jgi:hypothetical protein